MWCYLSQIQFVCLLNLMQFSKDFPSAQAYRTKSSLVTYIGRFNSGCVNMVQLLENDIKDENYLFHFMMVSLY